MEAARSAARDLSLFKPHLRLRPQRPKHVVWVTLALRPKEALLGPHLLSLLHSDLLPLSGLSLVRRAIRASRRSLPDPTRNGGFSEVGALSLIGGWRLPSQLLVGLEGSGGWTPG